MELRNEYIHVRCDKGTKEKLINISKVFTYLSQADIVQQALNEFYLKYDIDDKIKDGVRLTNVGL